jgi:hypothetical protein
VISREIPQPNHTSKEGHEQTKIIFLKQLWALYMKMYGRLIVAGDKNCHKNIVV